MSSREFTDRGGVHWRVTEIVPQYAERRKTDRRAVAGAAQSPGMQHVERRIRDRRRIDAPRATVASGYERGWLTFTSSDEKRRLAPVPEGWQDYSVERLELTCRLAERVEQRFGRLIE